MDCGVKRKFFENAELKDLSIESSEKDKNHFYGISINQSSNIEDSFFIKSVELRPPRGNPPK